MSTNESKEVTVSIQKEIEGHHEYRMVTGSIEDIIYVHEQVQELMKRVMKDGIHYGCIPGTDKPTLLKPGAEALISLFQLSPTPHKLITELGNGHREYSIQMDLHHRGSGLLVGSALGSCSTKESKWNTRWVPSGAPVPKDYWKKDQDGNRNKAALPPGMMPRKDKDTGEWVLMRKGENDNPADVYNTVLKMAFKRALVAAVMTCTNCSDVFTQDMEDVIDADEAPRSNPQPEPPQEETAPAPENPPAPTVKTSPLAILADCIGDQIKAGLPKEYHFKNKKEYTTALANCIAESYTDGATAENLAHIEASPAYFVKKFCAWWINQCKGRMADDELAGLKV